MYLGVGLGVYSLLVIILNWIHVPLNWFIFLILSLIVPVVYLVKSLKKEEINFDTKMFKLTKSNLRVWVLLVLAFVLFLVYVKGSFSYPWVEDGDPFEHLLGIEYVAEKQTWFFEDNVLEKRSLMHYLEPYPPTYDAIIGIQHQVTNSIVWTTKIFNVFLITLGHIFFYFFLARFMENKNKALFASFLLIIIPCFLSHFIWSSTLAITLFFPAFYCLEMIKKDKKWMYPSIALITAIMIAQPTNNVIFGIMFGIYWIVKSIYEKKFLVPEFLVGVVGLIASLIIYWIPILLRFGWEKFKIGLVIVPSIGLDVNEGNFYGLSDFMSSALNNKIDNPIGLGIVLFLLVVVSAIIALVRLKKLASKKNLWVTITLLWLLFAFLGLHQARLPLPFTLFAYRFWAIFAIPAVMIAAEGVSQIIQLCKKLKFSHYFVTIPLFVLLLATSAYPKYSVQTAMWPAHAYGSVEEMMSYEWVRNSIPQNSYVIPLCNDNDWSDRKIIGLDMMVEFWDLDLRDFRRGWVNKSTDEIHTRLKEKGYEFTTIDSSCVTQGYDPEEVQKKAEEMIGTGKFQLIHQNTGLLVFKII